MGKYYLLQIKRLFRVLPFLITSILILLLCLLIIFHAVAVSANQDGSVKFKLAFVGSAEDTYFQAGLEVVQAYDSSRFSIETFQMREQEAISSLEAGKIDAYVVIPEDYIKEAMAGRVGSLNFVSTTGAAELTTLFKDEITAVVSDIIIACEKAMIGVDEASQEYGLQEQSGRFSYDISLTYVDYILNRTDTYNVEVLGIRDSLGLDGYVFSGIVVLLLTLATVSVSTIYIKREYDVEKLLKSKGVGALGQMAGEYLVLFLSYSAVMLVTSVAVTFVSVYLPPELQRFAGMLTANNLPRIIAVVFLISSFGYLLFQLSNDLVSGVLLQFVAGVALCFASGCLYPVYFFPDRFRLFASFLPQAHARAVLASCLTGDTSKTQILPLILYGGLWFLLSWLIRSIRLRKQQR